MASEKTIRYRQTHRAVYRATIKAGYSPLQALVIANRIDDIEQLDAIIDQSLGVIQPPSALKDSDKAAQRLLEALERDEDIAIVTDYDVDGITSHAIIYLALTRFFHFSPQRIHAFIGHRIDDGYGLSQSLTERIMAQKIRPQLVITADCGSADEERIRQLKAAAIDVIVTDHHAIPAAGIPASAFAVINPTREDCHYQDTTIAGCMVSWLLMSQLRQRLIDAGRLSANSAKLSALLDFVSLGTIADAVSLASSTNRAVVHNGLKLLNLLQRPCWRVLQQLLGKQTAFTVEDLGFQIGPRINARSRMSDPYMALNFVLADDDEKAMQALQLLDQDNKDRRQTEKQMLIKARELAVQHLYSNPHSIVIYDPDFHAGVQGIVASRLVEAYGKPAIVLSPTPDQHLLTGSARTIEDIPIRDVLEQIAHSDVDIIERFGGHKGAAGLKLHKKNLQRFILEFERQIASIADRKKLSLLPYLNIDGQLDAKQLNLESLRQIEQLQPYGRGFEPPCFENTFVLDFFRQLGKDGEHLAVILFLENLTLRGIWFNALRAGDYPDFIQGEQVKVYYQLMRDEFEGREQIQLNIRFMQHLDL